MHQHFIKNKKVLLIYKNGFQEIAKYRITEKGIMYFFDHDAVPLKKLRCVTYYKENKN